MAFSELCVVHCTSRCPYKWDSQKPTIQVRVEHSRMPGYMRSGLHGLESCDNILERGNDNNKSCLSCTDIAPWAPKATGEV